MVSLIIPTLNAEKYISNLLESLWLQSRPPDEIIVIDSSSDERTVRLAESFGARVIVTSSRDFDHGSTRTTAGKSASGEILIFMTQDVLPVDNHVVEHLIKPFANDFVGAAYGRQLPHPHATPFAAHLRLFNYPENSYIADLKKHRRYGVKTPFLSNSFAAYRRKALEEIGWFREKMIMGEDTYAGAKLLLAGYKIAYVADALVYHSHNYKVWQEFKRYFDIGVFHNTERWIIQEFGSAEGEGMKYILSGLRFLANEQKIHLIPEFVLRAFVKYLGYKMGCHYEKLPKSVVPALSMHQGWWHR
jgi:rhamnosyltransferase